MTAGLGGKMTLVCAPAGYGKTTLLSTWLNQLDRLVAWLSLDEDDNSLARFFEYLIAALQTSNSRIGESIPAPSGSNTFTSTKNLLVSLINQLSTFPEDLVLVLDDYHTISEKDVHQLVVFLLDSLPPNMHMAIGSRTDPPLRLARLRAKQILTEIRAKDLRFNKPEAEVFLNKSMDLGLVSDDIETLVEKTEGWISGLQLAAISLKGHPNRRAFVSAFAGDNRYIVDYLLDEALDHQPPHIKDFLLQTSILERLNAPLCDALTGRKDSSEVLSFLERSNLFLVPLDSQRNWYRYHHLFASLLQTRLQTKGDQESTKLHLKASAWYEDHNLVNDALHHVIQARDTEQISKLVQKNIFMLVNHRDQRDLIRWAKGQPKTLFQRYPWISIAVARVLIDISQLDEVGSYLGYAEESRSADTRINSHIAATRASLADKMWDQALMLQYAREALASIDPDDTQLRAVISALLAKEKFWSGNLVDSEGMSFQAYEDSIAINDYEQAVINLTDVGGLQIVRGLISSGLETINKALRLAEDTRQTSGKPIASLAYTHFVLGDLFIETGDLHEADQHIQKGFEISHRVINPDVLYTGYLISSKFLLASGDLDGAYEAILKCQEMATLGGAELRQRDYFSSLKARVYIFKGEFLKARQLIDEIDIHPDDEFAFEKQLYYRILAKLLIAERENQAAIGLLTRLEKVCHNVGFSHNCS